jgi:hypothetical protein
MQAGDGRAARVAHPQAAQDGACPDLGAGSHHRVNRFIGGTATVGVPDAHHSQPTHRTGEPDHPVAGRPDDCAGLGRQVDATVTGAVRVGRRVEPPNHPGRPVERPAPDRRPHRFVPRGGAPGSGRRQDGQDQQGEQQPDHSDGRRQAYPPDPVGQPGNRL